MNARAAPSGDLFCRNDTQGLAGVNAARIVNGKSPADPTVEPRIKCELVISLMIAQAPGLGVPSTLLALSDLVIE